jgi:hypothetical protein
MIENEQQLRHSIQSVAKMYSIRDRIAAQTIGDPGTLADEIDGVESMIRKIEREVAEYLAKKYGLVKEKLEQVA